MHAVWRFSRGMTLGVRAMVIDAEGRVFLVRHSYVSGWYLPGGGVEAGETIFDALARELREEGGIALTGAPVLHGIYLNSRISRRDHVALFVVRAFHRGDPVRSREIVEHGFFSTDAMPADTSPATRARIAEVFAGAPLAERW